MTLLLAYKTRLANLEERPISILNLFFIVTEEDSIIGVETFANWKYTSCITHKEDNHFILPFYATRTSAEALQAFIVLDFDLFQEPHF